MNTTIAPESHGRIDYQGKKIGMWLFLYTELLFFGGMFLLYSIFRSHYPIEFHTAASAENLILGTVNTTVLLTSSLAIALAIASIKSGNTRRSSCLQITTIALGVVFLIIKYFEWEAKISEGLYPGSSVLSVKAHGEIMFFSLYFVMTGMHGLHVFIGIGVIAFMFVLTQRGSLTRDSFVKLENTGLYWHFVDIVWIYLFPLFYLIS
ncbi:MAG TPA: cytochrome c oxidase subunit 3 family protein [Dissulfurispiraceae bacterium]|nr:cytochrome c oxidase subunit 3 family protein [Dissulfurispiraceae bacterium]